MRLAIVGMPIALVAVLPLLSAAVSCVGAVGVHAGGVETGLGSILVGVIPVVGVVPIVGMIAIFVALRIPLGVRMGALAVRMAFLTVAPAGREREGKRGGKKDGEY